MKNLVFAVLLCIFGTATAGSQECLKPKYAREALKTIYLQQIAQSIDQSVIKARLKADEWASIDKVYSDIHRCFGIVKSCPEGKKGWSRIEHEDIGSLLIKAYQQTNVLHWEEALFFKEKLRLTIQDSECSDF